jgi:hypothetical protein
MAVIGSQFSLSDYRGLWISVSISKDLQLALAWQFLLLALSDSLEFTSRRKDEGLWFVFGKRLISLRPGPVAVASLSSLHDILVMSSLIVLKHLIIVYGVPRSKQWERSKSAGLSSSSTSRHPSILYHDRYRLIRNGSFILLHYLCFIEQCDISGQRWT